MQRVLASPSRRQLHPSDPADSGSVSRLPRALVGLHRAESAARTRPTAAGRQLRLVCPRKGRHAGAHRPRVPLRAPGRQGGRTYQRMRWSDPHIWGLREAQNLPMLQAQATIEPADPDDPDALAKAELIQRLLIDDFPWRSFLRDSFLDMDYGFSAFEIVWRIEDGETRFRLALRPDVQHRRRRRLREGRRHRPRRAASDLRRRGHHPRREARLVRPRQGGRPVHRPADPAPDVQAVGDQRGARDRAAHRHPQARRRAGPHATPGSSPPTSARSSRPPAPHFGLSPDAYFLHSEKVTAQPAHRQRHRLRHPRRDQAAEHRADQRLSGAGVRPRHQQRRQPRPRHHALRPVHQRHHGRRPAPRGRAERAAAASSTSASPTTSPPTTTCRKLVFGSRAGRRHAAPSPPRCWPTRRRTCPRSSTSGRGAR